jgi:hypothetical protein
MSYHTRPHRTDAGACVVDTCDLRQHEGSLAVEGQPVSLLGRTALSCGVAMSCRSLLRGRGVCAKHLLHRARHTMAQSAFASLREMPVGGVMSLGCNALTTVASRDAVVNETPTASEIAFGVRGLRISSRGRQVGKGSVRQHSRVPALAAAYGLLIPMTGCQLLARQAVFCIPRRVPAALTHTR